MRNIGLHNKDVNILI